MEFAGGVGEAGVSYRRLERNQTLQRGKGGIRIVSGSGDDYGYDVL